MFNKYNMTIIEKTENELEELCKNIEYSISIIGIININDQEKKHKVFYKDCNEDIYYAKTINIYNSKNKFNQIITNNKLKITDYDDDDDDNDNCVNREGYIYLIKKSSIIRKSRDIIFGIIIIIYYFCYQHQIKKILSITN